MNRGTPEALFAPAHNSCGSDDADRHAPRSVPNPRSENGIRNVAESFEHGSCQACLAQYLRDCCIDTVEAHAGVDTGDRIRLGGEGEAGENGGPPGDLYVQVHVKEHPIFQRDDANLYCEVPIPLTTAALGGELEVPTLDGKVMLKIPAGTQTGKMFRMRGKGVKPVRGGGMGDLICRVIVETPVNLTDSQKDLLRQFEESIKGGGGKHNPHATSWLDGVKTFFKDMGF